MEIDFPLIVFRTHGRGNEGRKTAKFQSLQWEGARGFLGTNAALPRSRNSAGARSDSEGG